MRSVAEKETEQIEIAGEVFRVIAIPIETEIAKETVLRAEKTVAEKASEKVKVAETEKTDETEHAPKETEKVIEKINEVSIEQIGTDYKDYQASNHTGKFFGKDIRKFQSISKVIVSKML